MPSHHPPPPPPPLYPQSPSPLPLTPSAPALPPTSTPPPPTIDTHRLHLLTTPKTLLGRGSFGSVYRGILDGAPVAVKIIRRATSNSNIAAFHQFQRELRRYERFRHPAIAQFYGVCELGNGRIGLVTEICEGGNLFTWLGTLREKGVRVPWGNVARLGGMIASGLFYLHEEGFTFGDLKSLNVLLTDGSVSSTRGRDGDRRRVGDGVRVKLCDFGLSRRLVYDGAGQGVGFGVVGKGAVGTLAYLAPEAFGGQVRNAERAKAVDIYAMGVVLYELCTQLGPWIWEGVKMEELEELVLREGKRPRWPDGCGVPKELRELVEMCWSQDPVCRPNIKEVVAELDRLQTLLADRELDEKDELDRVCKGVLEEVNVTVVSEEVTSLTESISEEDLLEGTFDMERFTESLPRTADVEEDIDQRVLESEIENMFRSSRNQQKPNTQGSGYERGPRIKVRSVDGARKGPVITPSAVKAVPFDDFDAYGNFEKNDIEKKYSLSKSDEEMRRISSDITNEDAVIAPAPPVVHDHVRHSRDFSSRLSALSPPNSRKGEHRRPLSMQDVEEELENFENLELDQLSMQKVGVKVMSQEEWSALGCR